MSMHNTNNAFVFHRKDSELTVDYFDRDNAIIISSQLNWTDDNINSVFATINIEKRGKDLYRVSNTICNRQMGCSFVNDMFDCTLEGAYIVNYWHKEDRKRNTVEFVFKNDETYTAICIDHKSRKEARETLTFLKDFFGFKRAFRKKLLATW